jgi:hypothetical protein
MGRFLAGLVVVGLVALACSDEPDAPPQALPGTRTRVLTISPEHVSAGDQVQVIFDAPTDYTWGVEGELWRLEGTDAKRIGSLSGWAGEPRMATVWPSSDGVFPAIGFSGRSTWKWKVPRRLSPGTYELRKRGISNETGSLEDRTKTWTARFEVVE